MDYLIVLPFELGLSADEFAISWNEIPECGSLAEASHFEPAKTSVEVLTGEIVTLKNVDENSDPALIYNLIRQALHGQGITAKIEISLLEPPEGTHVIVVRSSEL